MDTFKQYVTKAVEAAYANFRIIKQEFKKYNSTTSKVKNLNI